MEFKLSKEQELIQKTAREYAEKSIKPIIFQIDEQNHIPEEILTGMAELELFGIPHPTEYGGAGADYVSYALAVEQIARYSSAVAGIIGTNNMGVSAIRNFGTEDQKKKWMPGCFTGRQSASFAFTEPGTGSDPKMLTTTAKRDGDYYIINGTKRFTTNAGFRGPMITFAADEEAGFPSAFIIDKFCSGYSLSEPWEKIGQRGGHTYDVYLKDIRIPVENLLGERGKAFPMLIQNVAFGKIGLCAMALGRAQGALEESIKYAKEKTKRGKPIAQFATMQNRLAQMAGKVEAARWLTYRLAYLLDTVSDRAYLAKEAALTKQFVTETSMDIAREAVQVHGSYGVMKGYQVEIFYRDAIIGEIIEGSKDVQNMIVGSTIVG